MNTSDSSLGNLTKEEWIDNHLQRVSRTFALSLGYLPSPSEYNISLAYLACRIPDTIEDSQVMTVEEKSRSLLAYYNIFTPETNIDSVDEFLSTLPTDHPNTDDWKLVHETKTVIELITNLPNKTEKAAVKWIKELTKGMEQFISKNPTTNGIRIYTIDELEEYCHYVAGVVGHLIVDCLLSTNNSTPPTDTETLHEWAHGYGLYLQVTNIVKDVYDDYKSEDSIFIPINKLQKHGVEPTNITAQENAENVGNVITELIEHINTYEQDAQNFITMLNEWNHDTQVGFAIPYLLSVATLRKVHNNVEKASQEEHIKITRAEVGHIVEEITNETPFKQIADNSRTPFNAEK